MKRQRWWETSRVRALLWVAPCILAWSLIPRLALNPGNLDAFAFLLWSSAVSTGCLLICTAATGHWRDLRAYSTTDIRRIAALATLGAFLYYALLYSAYAPSNNQQKAAIVVITQYTWPALTVLWSAVLLRETLTFRMLISLLLGIVAVAIGASGAAADADALAKLPIVVLAAAVFGLYSTLLKRVAYEPYSSMAVGFAVATFLASLAAAQFTPPDALIPNNRTAMLSILMNGVFVNGLSYVCWYRALRSAPTGFVAPWVALTPLLAAVFANKSVSFELHHWAGIGLVLLSALLATVAPRARVVKLAPAARTPGRFHLAEESR